MAGEKDYSLTVRTTPSSSIEGEVPAKAPSSTTGGHLWQTMPRSRIGWDKLASPIQIFNKTLSSPPPSPTSLPKAKLSPTTDSLRESQTIGRLSRELAHSPDKFGMNAAMGMALGVAEVQPESPKPTLPPPPTHEDTIKTMRQNLEKYSTHWKQDMGSFLKLIEKDIEQLKQLYQKTNASPDEIARLKEQINGDIAIFKANAAAKERLSLRKSSGSSQASTISRPVHKISKGESPVFTDLDRGKAKIVKVSSGDDRYVYYVPVPTLLNAKERELQKEVRMAQEIRSVLTETGQSGAALAIDLEPLPKEEQIDGQYTVRTTRGIHDLEKDLLRDKANNNLKGRTEMCRQLLEGIRDIHEVGFVHGDLKADNIMVYVDPKTKEKHVKISDFGKMEKLAAGVQVQHTGNPRYMAPEGQLSQKAEVYSAALLMIRMLEEEVLGEKEGSMLIRCEQEKSDKPNAKRRGVEKFVVLNKHCSQKEHTLGGRVSTELQILHSKLTKTINVDAEKEISKYIHQLIADLKGKYKDEENLSKLEILLKDMTKSNPDERITSREAYKRFSTLNLSFAAVTVGGRG